MIKEMDDINKIKNLEKSLNEFYTEDCFKIPCETCKNEKLCSRIYRLLIQVTKKRKELERK